MNHKQSEPKKESIQGYIRRSKEESGVTLKFLSDKTGIPYHRLRNIIVYTSPMTVDEAKLIADVIKVPLDHTINIQPTAVRSHA